MRLASRLAKKNLFQRMPTNFALFLANMNRRKHTSRYGWASLALIAADVVAISQYRGQWEALILLLPTVAAFALAIEVGKRI